MNKGLRQVAKARMAQCQKLAGETGIQITYLFLAGEIDRLPTTAVACGAALAALNVPPVERVMRGSALGSRLRSVSHWRSLKKIMLYNGMKRSTLIFCSLR